MGAGPTWVVGGGGATTGGGFGVVVVGAGAEHAITGSRIRGNVRAMRTSRTILWIPYPEGVRLWAVLVVAVAACDPPGIQLEVVVNDPSITRVELLIGRDCTDADGCPAGIVAPGVGPKSVNAVYLNEHTSSWSELVSGGVAGFKITVDQETAIPIIVAIGFNDLDEAVAASTIHDKKLRPGDSLYWQTHLAPIAAIQDNVTREPTPAKDTKRLELWRQPSKQLSCLLLESWDGTATPIRKLVVPASDPDCDEVVTECEAWTPFAPFVPATIEKSDCVVTKPTASGISICVLGGPTCSESSQIAGERCAPLDVDYCTPLNLCSCAAPWQPECVRSQIYGGTLQGDMPYLDCGFSLDPATGELCSNGTSAQPFDASVVFPPGTITKCQDINVHPFTVPFGPFSRAAPLAQGTFAIQNFGEPCRAEVVWTGTAPIDESFVMLVELELDNDKHLVVPAWITFHNDCSIRSACNFKAGMLSGYMSQCMDVSSSDSCAPAESCDAGVPCGNSCCKPGEYCNVDQSCSCGGGPACGFGDVCTSGAYSEDQCGNYCCGSTWLCPGGLP